MRVSVNAGHMPGKDPGAVGKNGTKEADINRIVALDIVENLRLLGHEVQFIQSDSLRDICDISNDFGSDVFISVHCNAADSAEANGTETWAYTNSVASNKLAQSVQDALIKATGLPNRGVKQSSTFYVLRYTNCPAALIELAFISNLKEENMLTRHEYQRAAAKAIAEGVQKYAESN